MLRLSIYPIHSISQKWDSKYGNVQQEVGGANIMSDPQTSWKYSTYYVCKIFLINKTQLKIRLVNTVKL